jgi:hypothetical protein
VRFDELKKRPNCYVQHRSPLCRKAESMPFPAVLRGFISVESFGGDEISGSLTGHQPNNGVHLKKEEIHI